MRGKKRTSLVNRTEEGTKKMADRTPPDVLREQYRRLSDEELVDRVATGESEYTEMAWAVLQEEVSRRHLVANIEGLREKHLSTRKVIFTVESRLMMRRWAWGVAVLGTVAGLVAFLDALDYPSQIIRPGRLFLGLGALIQALFATLYLTNRASRSWAITATVFWLMWVIGTFPLTVSSEWLAGWAGGVAGSLVWAGFPLRYLYTNTYRPPAQSQEEEPL
jgi:hypothetical protein